MSLPPDEPPSEIERVVDAISEGTPVEWESELADPAADPATLEALRLIDDVARMHRGGVRSASGAEPDGGGERTWGNMLIRGPLGAGAYGEVYRAFDPGLRREVALKLWSATGRPRLIEAQLEEGRALARVRHPNVLLVHGADVHDGRVGMWTELLEGATLEQLIAAHGPGHWGEAALYGIELCRALAAVHAIGLVHRDVKASNVMRERGGRIVLMDFGSASEYVGNETGPVTGVQGSPLCMAPEVLNGAPASPASDIYSLGVLLFRLVAVRYPIEAERIGELRAALARGPLPSLRTLRPDVPREFAAVIERALERDPTQRIASATELERQLAEALSADWDLVHARSVAAPVVPPRATGRTRLLAWAAAGVATLAVALLGIGWLRRTPATSPVPPMQFTLQLPLGEHLPQFANVVVSPDGTRIAFASTDSLGVSALWVRRFDALTSVRLPGTEDASYPFWSPDGRNIGFFSEKHVKRVGVDGDSVRDVCLAELGRGGSWSQHGTILFCGSTRGPLMRVSAAGGAPLPATVLDTVNAEVSHRWPCFLPDGDHFLYVTTPSTKGVYALFAGSLHSDRRVYVGAVESGVVYTSGMLVYMFNQGLEARPFNVHTLRWAGEASPVSAMPGLGGSIAEPHASVSQNGTLVHTFVAARESRLAWIDAHTGDATTLAIGPYFDPSISPDGRRIVAERSEGAGQSNLWLLDANTGAAVRWTHDNELNRSPQWSPSGDSILFYSNHDGHHDLYTRSVDGSLTERRVYSPPRALMSFPSDWRPGGLLGLVLYENATGYNVYELRSGNLVPISCTAAAETHCALSPDSRWMAYDSDATGHTQVYVVDRKTSERYMLPTEGATQPRWARGTGRLYFRTPAGEFFELTPEHGKRPTEWPMRRLFRTGIVVAYDVAANSERLLCCVKATSGRPEEIAVLVNLPQAVARGL